MNARDIACTHPNALKTELQQQQAASLNWSRPECKSHDPSALCSPLLAIAIILGGREQELPSGGEKALAVGWQLRGVDVR